MLFSQNYNFYERNLKTGDILYSNLDYETRYQYEVITEDNYTKVKGYYYNSEIIKFIDTVIQSKIQKIEYFDKAEKPIYTCIYEYDDESVSSITTVVKEPYKMFYSINFDNDARKFYMISSIENKNGTLHYKTSNGKLDKNSNPSCSKLNALSFDGIKQNSSCIDEKWFRRKSTDIYEVKSDEKKVYSLEENIGLRKITNFQDGKITLTVTEISEGDREVKTVNYNGKETVNGDYTVCYKNGSFKHLLDNENQNKMHENFSVDDESVFLMDGKITTHLLFLPFDVLGDNDFHLGYVKMRVSE